jgi:protein phosphatase PTC1
MEDEHVIVDKYGGEETQAFFAIYDGHGGREVVEVIGKQLHKNLLDEMTKCYEVDSSQSAHPTIGKAMREAYLKMDKQIMESGMTKAGSTSVTVLLRKKGNGEKWLYTANVGDARAVLCRGDKAVRLSRDHKATDADEGQRIRGDGGWIVQGKVAGILSVTRAFGDNELKQWVIAEPFQTETELKPTDTHLIMACDGLWDVCTDQEAADLILEDRDASAQFMSEKLLNFALENSSKDNISIMVIQL